MIVGTQAGMITVRDAHTELGVREPFTVSRAQARIIASCLDHKGLHPLAAADLRRAAEEAEIG
ncbi:hypothetical protein H7J07_04940 [Mycobacterium koreense]|uniref:Uncharacterized protein n=1 Tax=Mycolicibacillus koreensis TaxID=1069220 RepID=A0A7I7SAR0_9MYCO|nr:hypothetical protein [Mycolicibacillus koreensis]MCV7247604.1 hypothetical protein [Mycolicibacillus koreensis]OSC32821.1 hypothetical protein B8W67_13965 [Mycolicibacillus koreensis]BBY53982.1 hypothetical protein MKOR_12330 [Mycolicibacillus koreensis]